MCGIAGIIGRGSSEQVIRMVRCLAHRGPDSEGIYSSDSAQLGHTRLSIIDLSSLGGQPMFSDDGNLCIIYNGECYNFKSIREDLVKAGIQFKSNSDTEVILKAFQEYGTDFLKRLNGMFALAIWDIKKRRLIAARDRFGIKPFYYSLVNNAFVFASEIKGLLSSGLVPFEINKKAVHEYFLFGYIQQPLTILQNVAALEPGNFLTYEDGKLTIAPYWSLTSVSKEPHLGYTYEEACRELKSRFNEATRSQMVSDRPLGLFLSGGLDSASVLASMAHNGVKSKTFSIGFEENPYAINEMTYAEEVAEHFGADHHQITLSGKTVADEIDNFFKSIDQPSVDGLNTFFVSKYARQEMVVALSGLGGDELFAGYSRHALIRWKQLYLNGVHSLANRLIPERSMTHPAMTFASDYFLKMKSYTEKESALRAYTISRLNGYPGVLSRVLSESMHAYTNKENFFTYLENWDDKNDVGLNRILKLEMQTFMSSLLLRDMDAVSMAHSLEVRFPMLDERVVELAFSIPEEFKLKLSRSRPGREGTISYRESGMKRILLDAFKDDLPATFSDRAKNGFKLPQSFWLKKYLKDYYYHVKDDETWKPFLNQSEVTSELDNFFSTGKDDVGAWKVFSFMASLRALRKYSYQ